MTGVQTCALPICRHWDISFAGSAFAHEFPGAAWLMMALGSIAGLVAIVGGGMYLLVTVWSVFLGRRIETPGFAYIRARDNVAPAPAPVAATLTGHDSAGFSAPGTFVMAMVFLVAFALYYFVNWKYLSTVWGLS